MLGDGLHSSGGQLEPTSSHLHDHQLVVWGSLYDCLMELVYINGNSDKSCERAED